ncbi:hypothetical protein Tco_0977629 [Tanacetum coccineum]|uniref:Uncharacterized protein n=1 Tax=Tanacetum coccineum TaxID=301880 RepID=A0ABQ5EL28_9ASTR
MYFVAYHNFVKPALGMIFLPDQSMYSNVLLLKPKMPSMPRKKRIRAIGDGGSLTRVTKVVEQTSKPKGVPGRPRNKQLVDDVEDIDVVLRGPVRDEGAGGSKGGKQCQVLEHKKRQGKKKAFFFFLGTYGFAKWFGLQDEPEQTQDEPQ